jgi:hypothetical protein
VYTWVECCPAKTLVEPFEKVDSRFAILADEDAFLGLRYQFGRDQRLIRNGDGSETVVHGWTLKYDRVTSGDSEYVMFDRFLERKSRAC